MKVFTYSVEQVIEVRANSRDEADDLLPSYPASQEGDDTYSLIDESVELISEGESA